MKSAVKFRFLLFLWILSAGAYGQGIKKIFCDFRKDSALSGAVSAFKIVDLASGKTITAYDADRLMIPASTMKTLYVFSALDDYGPDFRFATSLLLDGTIRHDTLFGDVIIRSEGDPSLASPRFDESLDSLMADMAAALQREGIRHITGGLVVSVNGFYYPAPGSWPIEDAGNYYGSGYWGLNYLDNTYKIYLHPVPRPGMHVRVHHIEPPVDSLRLVSYLKSAARGTGDNAYIYGLPYTYKRFILGTVPAGEDFFVIKGAIPNPPLSFARHLNRFLRQRGVQTQGPPRLTKTLVSEEGKRRIWHHLSPDLLHLGQKTLDYSINHYSEAMARLVVEKRRPADGYMNKDSINAYFHRKGFRRIDLEDGCGLAPDNLIAPQEYTAMFRRIYRQKGLAYLQNILPHAGEDGYAKYFLPNSPVQSRVWVKSGSVSKVRNYVGIFRGKSGKYYAFAIMVNHFRSSHKAVKKAIEKALERSIENL